MVAQALLLPSPDRKGGDSRYSTLQTSKQLASPDPPTHGKYPNGLEKNPARPLKSITRPKGLLA